MQSTFSSTVEFNERVVEEPVIVKMQPPKKVEAVKSVYRKPEPVLPVYSPPKV